MRVKLYTGKTRGGKRGGRALLSERLEQAISLVVLMPNITTNHAITYTNFSCNLRIYESENFSDSSLHRIFDSENFRFSFLYEKELNLGSEKGNIILQKIVGNYYILSFKNCT